MDSENENRLRTVCRLFKGNENASLTPGLSTTAYSVTWREGGGGPGGGWVRGKLPLSGKLNVILGVPHLRWIFFASVYPQGYCTPRETARAGECQPRTCGMTSGTEVREQGISPQAGSGCGAALGSPFPRSYQGKGGADPSSAAWHSPSRFIPNLVA